MARLTIAELPALCPGDQLFFRTEIKGSWKRWFVGFAIRVFTFTRRDKRPTVINHTANVVWAILDEGCRIVDYIIAEALAKGGYQFRPLLKHYGDTERISFAVARHTGVTETHRMLLLVACHQLRGKKYGRLKIVAHVVDYGLTKAWNTVGGRGDVYCFRWFARSEHYPICSWASLYIYDEAGLPYDVPVQIGSPDDLWDECRRKYGTGWLWPYCSRSLLDELYHPAGLGRASGGGL